MDGSSQKAWCRACRTPVADLGRGMVGYASTLVLFLAVASTLRRSKTGVDLTKETDLVDEEHAEIEVDKKRLSYTKHEVKLKKTVSLKGSVVVYEAPKLPPLPKK